MVKRKILSVVLCAAVLSAALCTGVRATGMGEFQKQRTYSGQFHDISGGWYEKYIADLYEYGLAEGVSADTMAPKDPVTVAQVVTLAARVSEKYYDGKIREADGAWYAPYISYAIDYGIITKEQSEDVDRPATRGESALILSRALPNEQFDKVKDPVSFSDIAGDDPCRAAVERLCCAGVITGYEDGTFRPEQGISRAEAMTIVDRMINKSLRSGYNEWLQSRPENSGNGGSEDNQGSDPIGVGVGFGRATFLSQGIAMLTVDMENSSFTLAVYANDKTGGVVTLAGVCEVKQDNSGKILMSCVVTDRAAQGGATTAVAEQAAALNMLGFVYDGNRSLTLTEAIKGGAAVATTGEVVVGTLKIGMTMTVAN